jgi:hypothetical protein
VLWVLLVLGRSQQAYFEYTHLRRLLQTYQNWYDEVVATPNILTVTYSCHTRWLVPIHQDYSPGGWERAGKLKCERSYEDWIQQATLYLAL